MGRAAILVMWPFTFITALNLMSLHMKFEINSPSCFWENMFYYFDGTPI